MASNYTANYKLPLWEGGDDFLREEFNEAHNEIDKALGTVGYETIASVTVEEQSNQIDLDVSNVDLTEYLQVELLTDFGSDANTKYIRVNDLSSGYLQGTWGTSISNDANYLGELTGRSSNYQCQAMLTLPRKGSKVGMFVLRLYNAAPSCVGYLAPVKWEEVESFNITGTIPAGSRVVLKGVRR